MRSLSIPADVCLKLREASVRLGVSSDKTILNKGRNGVREQQSRPYSTTCFQLDELNYRKNATTTLRLYHLLKFLGPPRGVKYVKLAIGYPDSEHSTSRQADSHHLRRRHRQVGWHSNGKSIHNTINSQTT